MIFVKMTSHADFAEWRDAARLLLQNNVSSEDVEWSPKNAPVSLYQNLASPLSDLKPAARDITAPKSFIAIAKRVICHRDPERFARLYSVLWRLQSERRLLQNTVDPDIMRLTEWDKAVRRDRHKMHAFVRFKKAGIGRYRREQFAAWFEPSHYITELGAPFFMRRFPNMDWIIVTPDCTAIWDGTELTFGPGGMKTDVPADDTVEDQWITYFGSIFNPARLKVGAMMSEMPKKYWKNLPEAASIPAMIATARERETHMKEAAITAPNPLAETLAARAKTP